MPAVAMKYTGARVEQYETIKALRLRGAERDEVITDLNKRELKARAAKAKRDAARALKEAEEERQRRIAEAKKEAESEAKRKARQARANAKRKEKRAAAKVGLATVYVAEDIESTLYNLWKALKAAGRVRLLFGGSDIDAPIGGYQDFRNLFGEGSGERRWYVDVGDKIVAVKPSTMDGKKLFQMFRDGIQHCVFQPILKRMNEKLDASASCSVKKRYRQRISALEALQEKYEKGVPEDAMEQVAKTAGLKIVMDIMGKQVETWNEKGQVGCLHLRNTRENHVEQTAGALVVDKDFEVVSEEQMGMLWASAQEMGNGEYMVEGNIKDGVPKKLHFLNNAYKVHDAERDIINEFSKSINIKQYELNATKYPDVNEFIKQGRIVNGWSAGINNTEPTGCLDMPKAYAQFERCSYYTGFMGLIHQFRTGDFDRKFIESHIGIYRFNIKKSPNRLARKLGLREGMSVVLPSPEILYHMDNGAEGTIDAGVWGGRMDFKFTEEMMENHRYQIWSGICGSERSDKAYTFPGSPEWADHLKATMPTATVHYWKHQGLITVRVPLNTVRTNHHILAFLTSYTRIQMLQAMSEFKYEQLCRVVLDGIYYCGAKPGTLDWFVDKPMASKKSDEEWYSHSDMKLDWPAVAYKNNTFISGQGGAGKTYGIMTDKGYNRVLYVVPQHVLGQRVNKQYGATYTTINQLIGAESVINGKTVGCRPYHEERGRPPVIVADEITQYPAAWVEKALAMYPDSLWLLVGDIDANGQWFQTRNGGEGGFSKVWKPTGVDYVYIEGDRRSRDEELAALKLKIRSVMREVFVDGDSGEQHVMSSWAKHNLHTVSFDEAVGKFEKGDTWIAGTHAINAKLLERDIVSGYYKKGGWISSEEVEGYEKRGSFTIHAYQGSTVESGKVFISIDGMFEYTMLYTAVSRAVHFDQLVFVY
jgi:hypothetical protein